MRQRAYRFTGIAIIIWCCLILDFGRGYTSPESRRKRWQNSGDEMVRFRFNMMEAETANTTGGSSSDILSIDTKIA